MLRLATAYKSPLLSVEQVRVTYALPDHTSALALAGVDLCVGEGEWVAVVGANGSGKSTLVKLLCGLLLPDEGVVTVGGLKTSVKAHLPLIRQRLGVVWQEPDDQIIASIVEEEVAFGLEIMQMEPRQMHERVTQTLLQAGLLQERARLPHQLSGGQRQRLALAAALAPDPACIVLDEATSMIDEAGKADILAWLQQLHQSGKAIVSVTHDMREAALAQRIVVMQEGIIVADGSAREVFALGERLQDWGLHPPLPAAVSLLVQRRYQAFTAPALGVAALCQTYDDVRATRQRLSAMDDVGRSSAPSLAADSADLLHSDAPSLAAQKLKSKPIIELRGVQYVHQVGTPFARQALYDVHLTINRGEHVAIVGHTGSGKSTLMQLLNGLLLAEPGQVRIGGLDPSLPSERALVRRKVGLLFQNPERQLFERYVGDDIAFGPLRQGLTLDQARERVRDAMRAVKLPWEYKDRPIHALSGGQKRRVGIAGVLALEPDVLVLDEPTAGLDPASADELLGFLVDYQRAREVTILLVTHRLQEAAQFAERLVVMRDGRIVHDGIAGAMLQSEHIASWGFPVPDFVELTDKLSERHVHVSPVPPSAVRVANAILAALAVTQGGDDRGATTGTVG